jgi:RNA polymerase sigma-70 factor (ECF subfamily)
MTSSVPSPTAARPRRFATTRWSLIQQAAQGNEAPARAALEELCQAYWLPVYAFMRRQTRDRHEAQDWTQGFFASLLSRDALAQLTPERGRFRSFLLAAASHFASNERDKRNTIVRGGHVMLQSIDYEDGEKRLAKDLSTTATAESLFERQWAHAVLDRVLQQLREEYYSTDRHALFDTLVEHLGGVSNEGSLTVSAERLQMSAEAIRVSLHRLRKRYRALLRNEIAQTTNTPAEIDDEIRYLFLTLAQN